MTRTEAFIEAETRHLRPVSGWRSLRWDAPPTHATRAVPAGDRDAAVDWHAQVLGM